MNLPELNSRWQVTGHPHAVLAEDELYRWYCPRCKGSGEIRVPLVGAMSDAVVHKRYCPALS